MAKKGTPGPGQHSIEIPFDVSPEIRVDLHERKSTSGMLNQHHLGKIALEKFTTEMVTEVSPERFEEVLFTANSRSESRNISGLAINAREAEIVPGSVNNLNYRVAQRTEASRLRRGDNDADRRARKQHKSKTETLRGYISHKDKVLAGLKGQLSDIDKLAEALVNPGRNRGYVITQLPRIEYIFEYVFKNMHEVLADELKWDQDKRDSTWEALRYSIIEGPDKINTLRGLTNTARKYVGAKHNIFKGKYGWAERGLVKLEKQSQPELLESEVDEHTDQPF